jgi:Ca2+ transporting ATPase
MAGYGEESHTENLIMKFKITAEQLMNIVDSYRERKFTEDVDAIEAIGDIEDIACSLMTDLNSGLSADEDKVDRIGYFGSNQRGDAKRQTFCQLLYEATDDFMLRLLLVAGVVSLGLGIGLGEHPQYEWIEGFAIIFAVVLVVFVTAINNYKKELKFAELQETSRNREEVSIIRSGRTNSVNPRELLVGDLLVLADGIVIPGDGILLEGQSIAMDEAAMTGENEKLEKESLKRCLELRNARLRVHPEFSAEREKPLHERADHSHDIPSPIILSGTKLAEGQGLMLVIAVGSYSAEGRIIDLAGQETDVTPLELKLEKLAHDISKFGTAAAVIAVVVLYVRFFIELGTGSITWSNSMINDLIHFVILGITVLVLAIPEGLPLAVTISLAYSISEMQEEKNMVKRMHACETMGGADMICSDKTGTLTTNNMSVAKVFFSGQLINFEDKADSTKFEPKFLALIKEGICCNSTAYIDPIKGEQGSKTELAMLKMLTSLGHADYIETRKRTLSAEHRLFPFSSERKRSSMVVTCDDLHKRVHVKGGAEMIVKYCTHYLNKNSVTVPIDQEIAANIEEAIDKVTSHGLRAIAMAFRELPAGYDYEAFEEGVPRVEIDSLVFVCITAIKDPVRDNVPKAVEDCKRAHIKVRMVTGDNAKTARSIAQECGILMPNGVVMDGPKFTMEVGGVVCKNCRTQICDCPRDKRSAATKGQVIREDVIGNIDRFRELVVQLDVMARSKPDDKYCLVTGLKEMGHVVAVTGDGTNDAPALKKADIGFAMGIAGTQMAREAADIILMDDNFASIVRAVLWGRNIYDNIQRFIQFQLTVNIVAVSTAIVGAVTIKQSSLTAVQMLWVNLIMDTFASLALATQPPKEDLLERLPQSRNDYIITKKLWKHIFGQALIQVTLIFCLMYLGETFLPEYGSGKRILYNQDDDRYVRPGRLYHLNGEDAYIDDFKDPDIGPSRHFTYLFNIFVLLQLFNEFNSRKIKDELNVFDQILRNRLFLYIWFLTFGLQVFIVQVGNYALAVHYEGLTVEQWFICIAFGLIPLPLRLVLRLIPERCFKETGNAERSLDEKSALGISLRRSQTSRLARMNSVHPSSHYKVT